MGERKIERAGRKQTKKLECKRGETRRTKRAGWREGVEGVAERRAGRSA